MNLIPSLYTEKNEVCKECTILFLFLLKAWFWGTRHNRLIAAAVLPTAKIC